MSKYIVTVIKTGNSYALRVPKQYIEDGNLKLGQKASIPLPVPQKKQDLEKIHQLFEELAAMEAFGGIEDPVRWQREARQERPLPGRG